MKLDPRRDSQGRPRKYTPGSDETPRWCLRPAVLVERVDLQPAVVEAKPTAQMIEVMPAAARSSSQDGIGHAVRVGAEDAGLRLLGQVETVAGDVGVGLVEHGQIVRVAVLDVGPQVGRELHDAVVERTRHAPAA